MNSEKSSAIQYVELDNIDPSAEERWQWAIGLYCGLTAKS